MPTLEEEFHREMVAIYEGEKGYGYYAAYFKQMLDKFGGVEAAKQLLAKGEIQQGLMTLWEMGHLGNSVEAHILKSKFKDLFTDEELSEARRRLQELRYEFPD